VTAEPQRTIRLQQIARQLGARTLPNLRRLDHGEVVGERRLSYVVSPPLFIFVHVAAATARGTATAGHTKNHNLRLRQAPRYGDVRSSCYLVLLVWCIVEQGNSTMMGRACCSVNFTLVLGCPLLLELTEDSQRRAHPVR
jgi:hypothetical protein